MRIACLLLLLFFHASCGSTGQRELTYPVFGQGEASAPFNAGGWEVTLTVAEVGFGPAYFCATAAASSDLCPTAVSQFARTATLNGLDPTPQRIGEADGQTGTVRSATYDYGISWFATQRQPTPGAAAPRNHSAYFEGQAVKDGRTVRFVAPIDVVPRFQGTRVVQGVPAEAELASDAIHLTVGVRPGLWWQTVDFDALAQTTEDPVRVAPGSRAYEALVLAMTATATPALTWAPAP